MDRSTASCPPRTLPPPSPTPHSSSLSPPLRLTPRWSSGKAPPFRSGREGDRAPAVPSEVILTLIFLVAAVNTSSTKTHSSKEISKFSFENEDVKRHLFKQRADEKQICHFLQNVSKGSSVSRAHLLLHTYTARVEWCGLGHLELMNTLGAWYVRYRETVPGLVGPV